MKKLDDDYKKPSYWVNAEERAGKAKEWVEFINTHLKKETEKAISNSMVIKEEDRLSTIMEKKEGKVQVLPMTTVEAIMFADRFSKENHIERIAALNFASFTSPGGKFLEGSSAQEESLCHASNLYPILKTFQKTFYDVNYKNKRNNGLYHSDMIYSEGVTFLSNDCRVNADVITCAAPFTRTVLRYKRATEEVCQEVMRSRIQRILQVAYAKGVDCLILGAFGCGVFGNDPRFVARTFQEELDRIGRDKFHWIIFAIPSLNDQDSTIKIFLEEIKDGL